MPMLILISGLPCTGKSSLSEALATELAVPVFSVDPIEAALWRSGIKPGFETGIAAYEVAAALAGEQLKLGHSAIIDAVNPVEAARKTWRDLSAIYHVRLVLIETHCSDIGLHRKRVEDRVRNIPGMPEITWDRVEERRLEYEPWQEERLVLDSVQPVHELVGMALDYICASHES